LAFCPKIRNEICTTGRQSKIVLARCFLAGKVEGNEMNHKELWNLMEEMTVRELASLGGKARAKALSSRRRKEIAASGAAAREHRKHKQKGKNEHSRRKSSKSRKVAGANSRTKRSRTKRSRTTKEKAPNKSVLGPEGLSGQLQRASESGASEPGSNTSGMEATIAQSEAGSVGCGASDTRTTSEAKRIEDHA
jgi:hypothetical protein